MISLSDFKGFDWDKANKDKNWIKHKISNAECEEIFFNLPLIVTPDKKHSNIEERYYVLGKTNRRRLLFLVFTPRGNKIRIISSRDMTKKERRIYHETEKKNP